MAFARRKPLDKHISIISMSQQTCLDDFSTIKEEFEGEEFEETLIDKQNSLKRESLDELQAMTEWYAQPVTSPEQGKCLERLSYLKPLEMEILALMAHKQSFEEIQTVLDLPRRELRLRMTQLMNQLEIRDSSQASLQYYYDLARWGGWLD